MVHRSPLPDVEIPTTSMTDHVLARAAERGDAAALIDGPTGRVLTYAQLDGAVRSFAAGLHDQGFGRGDVLALMAPNLPEYAVVFHGVALAGGVLTTINPTYTPREVASQLQDSAASRLVTIVPFLETALAAVADTGVRRICLIGSVDDVPAELAAQAESAGVTLVSLAGELSTAEGATSFQQVPVDPEDLVVLPYSSGTTGLSKGVMLSHRNLNANVVQVAEAAQLEEGETLIAVLPFFHIYGMQVIMNCGLWVGATIVSMPRFDLEQFLRLHQEHGVTRSFVAPPIVVALAKHPLVDSYDLSALKQVFSGAAPLSADTADQAARRLNCEVVQGYGMTELSPVSHLTPPGNIKSGSVGLLAPNTEMRIVDPSDGSDCDIDVDGEIWVRGPQNMRGYLNNDEATTATIDHDGWLHTGDIGHIDADQHVFVVDRLKELIKYKGYQVPPAELESLLLSHQSIADAAVIARPDEESGEIPVAFVVRTQGADVSADEVMAFVADQVAHYKRVREVTFVDAIPKSASGKILRRVLRDGGSG